MSGPPQAGKDAIRTVHRPLRAVTLLRFFRSALSAHRCPVRHARPSTDN
jgi:hypothetical protein